jgi:putative transposase
MLQKAIDTAAAAGERMGIKQKLISSRSPWQSPYVERLVGSIRRECLDQVIVFNEQQLRQILDSYFEYYHKCFVEIFF